MRFVVGVVVCAALLFGCSTNFESECLDLCDRGRRCVTDPDPEVIDRCNTQCREVEEQGQMRITDGTLSQSCYDAVVDELACANRLNCRELSLISTSTPARCKSEIESAAEICRAPDS